MGSGAERRPLEASSDVVFGRLWAGDLCVEHADDTLSISVRLGWDTPWAPTDLALPERLRIDVSDLDRLGGDRRHLLAAHTPPNATALVPVLAVIAAIHGADLTIDAPVCPVALAGARRMIGAGHQTHAWPAVTLGATAGAISPQPRRGHALVFSLDLETMATLVALQRSGRGPTHLVTLDDTGCHRWRTEAMAANAARLPLVRVSTNASRFLPSDRRWAPSQGAPAVACALALAGVVGSVTIPTRSAHTNPGSADLATLWSSEAVTINEAPVDLTAAEANSLVATDPWARQWLRVCTSGDPRANCGACWDCQFTLTHFWLAGASGPELMSFGHDADPAIVRALHPRCADRDPGLHDLVDALALLAGGVGGDPIPTSPDDRLLAAALADAWSGHLGVEAGTAGTAARHVS